MNEKPERRCPMCNKPITLKMDFCMQDWSKLPATLRDLITMAKAKKNFLAKANAVKMAEQWFHDKRLHLIK